jgi:GNAT superfamily N-acetyltransferase
MRDFKPDLKIYSPETLPSAYEHQIRSFVRIEWTDLYQNSLEGVIARPKHNPMHFVLVEADALYSSANVMQTSLEHQNQTYITYGLGGVFTYPAFRKRGYGAWVVGAATDYIRQRADADIAVLWTLKHNIAFYEKLGWEHISQIQMNIGDPENPYRSAENLMMLFVSEKAKNNRSPFEQSPVYFGKHFW